MRRRTPAVLAAIGVLALVPVATDSPFHLNLFILIGIYTLLTVGLSLLFGFTGQISMAHAAFYGIGAYTSGILSLRWGLPVPLAMVAAALIPAILAYALGRAVLRLKHFYLALATLALGDMVSVLFVEQKNLTGGFTGLAGIPPFAIAGLTFDTPRSYFYLVWVFAGLVFAFSHNVIHSRVGRALRAINGSERAAGAMGVDVVAYKTSMFALGAAYAGLAGSLYAHYVTFISPEAFTSGLSIVLIVMLYIGGLRSLWGAVLGAAFAVLLPELLSRYKNVDVIVYGLVLLVVMMFLPGGLAGLIASLVKGLRRAIDRVRSAADGRRASALG